MINRNNADSIMYSITMGLCFLALLLLPFEQGFALKSLRIAGEIALLA
ncbi:TPA: O-antigen ligase domain-containing protein, partial [Citrobacter freundii]|nr:O-antigen ligase domain-containing protein [Citrobacter freundii]